MKATRLFPIAAYNCLFGKHCPFNYFWTKKDYLVENINQQFCQSMKLSTSQRRWKSQEFKDDAIDISVHSNINDQFSSVQSLSHVQLFATPWTAAHQASLSISNSWSLPKLMSIESVMPSNYHILCRPLFFLPSIFPQHQGRFK